MKILDFEKIDELKNWRSIYTLGIVSRPIWMTISSQQMRAANISKEFIDSITENPETLKRNDAVIKIAIIGGGIGGMTLAYCLHSYKAQKQKFSLEIDVFEKHDVICPIQRGCYTRRIHPNFQFWPAKYEEDFEIFHMRDSIPYSALHWKGGITAADVATQLAEEYFRNFNHYNPSQQDSQRGKSEIKIYQSCKYLKIQKSINAYDLTFSGLKIKNRIGDIELSDKTNKKYDAIFLATGFGIERDYIEDKTKIKPIPYWRNDSLGQPNLNDEPHRYLISGNGDGAIADILRTLIIDYKPDKLLNTIKNLEIEYLLDRAKNIKIKKTKENIDTLNNQLRSFIEDSLLTASKSNTLQTFNDLWNKKSWSLSTSIFKLISETIIWPRVKSNIEVICHFKNSDNIKEIIDNPAVTFYNKFLFFTIWGKGIIKTTTGEIFDVAEKNHIKHENIIIRHGADSVEEIKKILSPDLFSDFKVKIKRNKHCYEDRLNDYKKGKYLYATEISKPLRVKFNDLKYIKIRLKKKRRIE